MAAQYDLYRMPGGGLVVVLQSDLLDQLRTQVWNGVQFWLCRAFGAVELPERYISANLMEVADGFMVFATRLSTGRVEGRPG